MNSITIGTVLIYLTQAVDTSEGGLLRNVQINDLPPQLRQWVDRVKICLVIGLAAVVSFSISSLC